MPPVQATSDAVNLYNSLVAVSNNPDALGREIARHSPDLVFRALKLDVGRALPIGGYFLSAGINLLDADTATAIANIRLRNIIEKLAREGALEGGDAGEEYANLRQDLATNPARAVQMIIVYRLRQQSRQ